MSRNEELFLYYDGACGLCSSEMKVYKSKDRDGVLRFVNIASPDFDLEGEGLFGRDVNKYFHVKDSEGYIYSGVAAFDQIWRKIGVFRFLKMAYAFWPTKVLMDLGYCVFVRIRPYLPKSKSESCSL